MHLRWAGLSWLHLILILETDSSSSSHLWKLNREAGLIQSSILQPLSFQAEEILHDPLFSIILSTHHEGSAWVKKSSNFCTNCKRLNSTFSLDDDVKDVLVRRAGQSEDSKEGGTAKGEALGDENISGRKEGGSKLPPPTLPPEEDDEPLDCGKPVNFTYYDNLVGISNRLSHPNVPEPQISLIFKNKKSSEIDIGAVERKLKKAKREKPKSVQLYNQIGNFWRLKGDTYKSIECFRRALAVSPHNAEVLLNLARVLFTLQYLDDAIYLTRRSLEVQPPDKSAWQQYFTLGEIFKAYGHYQEASLHMRHCLQLRPAFEPALTALKEMETTPDNNIHVYTLLIIVCLVLGVLLVIISSLDSTLETDSAAGDGKARHFNKAMAMRSLKMGISPRSSAIRSRHRHSNHSG